ncbi:MAG: ADP-ribosylation factor-like protein [Nitrospirota bacterium]
MALFNYATKEITIKIVYYGPGLSGKTTNLQYLHAVLDPKTKGKLLSLATESDRTLFFDFLPVEIGKIRGFSVKFQLYTVPGQVRYNATRKLVLRGVDAVIFVADSQRDTKEQNIESFKNMFENLIANNINPEEIPIILQYNKRDLPNILSIDELNNSLNKNKKYKHTEAVAVDGIGVENTFQHITKLVLENISRKYQTQASPKIPPEPTEVPQKPVEVSLEPIEIPEKPVELAVESTEVPEKPVELPLEPIEVEIFPEKTATSGDEESIPIPPIFETLEYESPDNAQYAMPATVLEETEESIQTSIEREAAIQKEHVEEIKEEPVIQEEHTEEIKEKPIIPEEKLNLIISHIADLSQILKELKNITSELLSEIKNQGMPRKNKVISSR